MLCGYLKTILYTCSWKFWGTDFDDYLFPTFANTDTSSFTIIVDVFKDRSKSMKTLKFLFLANFQLPVYDIALSIYRKLIYLKLWDFK